VKYIKTREDRYLEGEELADDTLMNIALNKYTFMKENEDWGTPTEQEEQLNALSAEVSKKMVALNHLSKTIKKRVRVIVITGIEVIMAMGLIDMITPPSKVEKLPKKPVTSGKIFHHRMVTHQQKYLKVELTSGAPTTKHGACMTQKYVPINLNLLEHSDQPTYLPNQDKTSSRKPYPQS